MCKGKTKSGELYIVEIDNDPGPPMGFEWYELIAVEDRRAAPEGVIPKDNLPHTQFMFNLLCIDALGYVPKVTRTYQEGFLTGAIRRRRQGAK